MSIFLNIFKILKNIDNKKRNNNISLREKNKDIMIENKSIKISKKRGRNPKNEDEISNKIVSLYFNKEEYNLINELKLNIPMAVFLKNIILKYFKNIEQERKL